MTNRKVILGIILIFVAVVFVWSVFVEPNRLVVTKYTIRDEALAGVKIVFASDFHIKPYQKKWLQRIVQLINEQNPDIVLSVGDFVSGHLAPMSMPIKKIAGEFQNIKAPYGFYTTIGNHDLWFGVEEVKRVLEENNVKVLDNSNLKIRVKGKEIYIAGVQYKPTYVDVGNALENTKSPTIMLTHSPDEIVKMPEGKANLILAGHTHGGQVVIPLLGPVLTASAYGSKYVYGLIEENGKRMLVTRGIGTSILPIRFNCPPEIVVIEFADK